MTTIRIDRYALTVTASGHACYDNTGSDIVCSAASMLMYALNAFARENGGIAIERPGYMHVELPAEENDYLFGGFDSICEGLRILADEYPEHIFVKG